MSAQIDQEKRVRAWLIVQVEPGKADSVAKEIYSTWGNLQEDALVLIRADVVDGDHIVIPVDAGEASKLESVKAGIDDLDDASVVQVYKVQNQRHTPYPPHAADGFIHPSEAAADTRHARQIIKIGRQRNSPGENPWG
ncbi:MAG: hypothetical protein GTO14_07605 [Anaerolineales bacterium]|nr:hypothetical protein [Anaerolineales bacterium]